LSTIATAGNIASRWRRQSYQRRAVNSISITSISAAAAAAAADWRLTSCLCAEQSRAEPSTSAPCYVMTSRKSIHRRRASNSRCSPWAETVN